ncbi:hypothetical protein DPMN_004309 [Dreissena polymorpha]|uniref:Uncharacterized protein n=1 Tax=Dreissena polymorpha TaxID=45954 RepID=A0A9D4RVI2_DREPO|nr:hypothetical protein DPMN_004309 [Dreissena polymorpha]
MSLWFRQNISEQLVRMKHILLLSLFVAVVNGNGLKVNVSSFSCGKEYSLNMLNDDITLQYDGRQLPQWCSIAVSTSQIGENLCFEQKFENTLLTTMSYKVEYYQVRVSTYADKTIDSISDTIEWCALSSKVFVLFVSGRGSSVQPEIEIKIKIQDDSVLSSNVFEVAKTIGVAVIGIIVGVVVLVIVACVVVVCCCLKRQRNRRGQVVRQPQTTMAATAGQPCNQGGYQMVPSNDPAPTGYQGYPPPSQAGYQPPQGYPQAPPAGYQPGPTGYPPAEYQQQSGDPPTSQQSGYPPATQAGYPPGPTG